MSLSVAARCPRTGMFGIAIAASSLACGGRTAFARPAVGAVVTQYRDDPRLGLLGLDMLTQGRTPVETIDALVVNATPHHGWRQLACIDRHGRIAHFTGGQIPSTHAVAVGSDAVALGCLLRSAAVPQAMTDAFDAAQKRFFGERLLAALETGAAGGGEIAPLRSAALLIVHRQPFPLFDLRIDDDADPVAALRRLYDAFEPASEEYLVRAIAPDRARPDDALTTAR
jgi:uncharacterized Ntn-hydrolase superfamily protein